MWYMCVLAFWLMYAMFYGMWWCCKKIVQGIARAIGKGAGAAKMAAGTRDDAVERLQANTYANATVTYEPEAPESVAPAQSLNFCPKCGAELIAGNSFCTKCGNKIS